jgi:hypothetical protein
MSFEALFRDKFDICEQIWGGTFRLGLGVEKVSGANVDANKTYMSHYAFFLV